MGSSVEDKYLIKSLRENKRYDAKYGAKRLLNIFPNKYRNLGARKVLMTRQVLLIDVRTVVDLALSAQLLSSTKLKICHYASKEVCLRHLKQAFYSIVFSRKDLIKYLSSRLKPITKTAYLLTSRLRHYLQKICNKQTIYF